MDLSVKSMGGIPAPTIDQVDAANTPSLVGFWKCYDIEGDTVPDHSGNSYDLKLVCTKQGAPIGAAGCDVSPAFSLVNGFLKVGVSYGYLIDVAGTLLDTGANHVLFSAEFYNDDNANDTDIGTACFGNALPSDAASFTGFNLGSVGSVIQSRVRFDSGGSKESQVDNPSFPQGDRCAIAGCFKPSAAFTGAYHSFGDASGSDTVSGIETGTGSGAGLEPAALVAQNNYFGVRCSSGTSDTIPVRNLQVWSFPSAPVYLDETAVWLASNPGAIPPWWIGR
jgi:hypothetical protein